MQKTTLYKKIFRLLLFPGLAVTLFAFCTKDNRNNTGFPEPPGIYGYTLAVDEKYTFGTITTVESDFGAGIPVVYWESSNPAVAAILDYTAKSDTVKRNNTVFIDTTTVMFEITAVVNVETGNSGSAELTATVTYTKKGQNVSRKIPGRLIVLAHNHNSTHDDGVVINGVKWATRNVNTSGSFTARPEDPGLFYQWGNKVDWNGQNAIIPWRNDSTTWENPNDPCPKGWRIPAREELQSLARAENVWQPRNGVNGYWFVGDSDSLIFLPAAGYRSHSDSWLYLAGTYGNYWSNAADSTNTAYSLGFGSSGILPVEKYNAGYGFSCRCVEESE